MVLAQLFHEIDSRGYSRNRSTDLRLNLQPVGDMLFMKGADPFADKTYSPLSRAGAAIVASSAFEHCALARSFKRVVCYWLADLLLVVEDGSVATIDKTECGAVQYVEDGGGDVDAHMARMMPQRGHEGEPDPVALAESESELTDVHLRLRHVRVATSRNAARTCDPSLYLSGAVETQTFWVSKVRPGVEYRLKSEPGLLRKDIEQWEDEKDEVLRSFTCLLTRLQESACGEAARNPLAKKFVCDWRVGWSTMRLWYGPPDADGGAIQFSRFPYLLSEDLRQVLEEILFPRGRI